MSYLNPLRLHFAGRFQTNVSTVNNDPLHFDNANFKPSYQERTSGNDLNGWWNPDGDGTWKLLSARVTAAFQSDGTAADSSDAVLGLTVNDSDRQVPAKLVDLDPEQQMVSEIWGLELRLCTPDGKTVLRGRFKPVGFMDIWVRTPSSRGDASAAAFWQSVLTDLEWGDYEGSKVLKQLHDSVSLPGGSGALSVKLNADSYQDNYQSPDFTCGRITGTLGPHEASEPEQFVAGRQLIALNANPGGFPVPAGQLNTCVARVDTRVRKVFVDLGNALPNGSFLGAPKPLGDLSLACNGTNLGPLVAASVYTDPAWLPGTAGVVEFPVGRSLTDAELKELAGGPVSIVSTQSGVGIAEVPSGLFVRADRFVYRLNPGEEAEVRLFATEFGEPAPGMAVALVYDPTQLQGPSPVPGPPSDPPSPPVVGVPVGALAFEPFLVTDDRGVAVARLRASESGPGNPRGYIDGQVYGVRPLLPASLTVNDPLNAANFVSVLVFDRFTVAEPVTWYGGLEPIFRQFANLYPVMKRFVDLGDPKAVWKYRQMLTFAFRTPISDPNAMPVTRDMSDAKRAAILKWLGAETMVLGTPAAAAGALPVSGSGARAGHA